MSVLTDKKTKRLFIQFEFEGETYKKRLPAGSTVKEGEKLEIKWKHDLFFAANLPEEKEAVLWERFVEDVYLPHVKANNTEASLDKAIVICRAAMPFLGGKPIRDIKPSDVEQFKALRMQTQTRHGHKRKPSTVHREMSIVSRIFALAMRNDHCDRNPVSLVDLPKFDNTQDLVLEVEQAERFFASFRNSLQREIATVTIFTGLRQNDILGLTKKDVHWQRDEIILFQGKTKRRVAIPTTGLVKEILLRRRGLEGDLLFPSYRKPGEKMKSIKHALRNACIRAGIPKLGMRELRRSFGTWLHELGYDDGTVASLLGHSDLRSVHRYKRGTKIRKTAILSLENLAESAKIPTTGLNGLFANSPEPAKTLVEMRRIELLASALRTDKPAPFVAKMPMFIERN